MDGAGLRARWRRLPRSMRQVGRLVVVAVVCEYLLVPQLAGSRNSWHLLLDVSNGWLLFALALESLSLLVYAMLTRAVLPVTGRLSLQRVLRIDLATLAVSHLVPAGSAVGLGLGYQLLTAAGVDSADAVVAKAAQAVGSAIMLNLILWCALVASLPLHGFDSVYAPVAAVGVLLLTGAGTAALMLTRHERQVAERLGRILGHLPLLTSDGVSAAVTSAAAYLHHLRTDRRLLRSVSALAAVNWLLDAAALWACVRAFGHTLGPIGLLVPYGIANVLAAIPITPSGLGVVEAFLIPALIGFSTPRGVAILGVLAWRAVNFLLPVGAGLLAYLTLPAHDAPTTRP